MLQHMNPKQRAAEAALEFVQPGMKLGLGTGSTADYFLQALGAALKSSRLRDLRGVPTSRATERRARPLGIPISSLTECGRLDLTVDGADEIDPNLDLIKGLGGALVREKIVAQNSRTMVVIADASKRVAALGSKAALPVEVVQFCHESHAEFFRSLGATPTLRKAPDGTVFVTDNDNVIYDLRFDRIADPERVDVELSRRAGVVDSGLFLGIAQVALIGTDSGVEKLTRGPSTPAA
jgi:ribose 5-phosphate isomerase A